MRNLLILSFLLFTSCSLEKIVLHHGVHNLEKKQTKLKVNFTTQSKFLSNLGISQRAEIISKNKTFKEKSDIFYRLKRLIDENEMGNLFKVMLVKNSNNNSQTGF